MANVTGVVEVYMTNKFDSEKVAMKLEGNDTWYSQKKEWIEVAPKKGDTVEFSPGKGQDGKPGKYIQYLKILESASGEAQSTPRAAGNNNIGIELGHAANNATQLVIAQKGKAATLEDVEQMTVEFYKMMKKIRQRAEQPKEEPKKAEPKKAEDFDDDDIPF